ncbi:uncharacterized protein LOC133172033 [Saccostrea echinata]|uniref:uncharacterized protein LOC133172033 n=1 Tax=Saccostrea echinata TaxID=191078 RepID=UPI002A7FFA60|nr:uncharacterized protein LOC133172033 [Saccostrea echinata]
MNSPNIKILLTVLFLVSIGVHSNHSLTERDSGTQLINDLLSSNIHGVQVPTINGKDGPLALVLQNLRITEVILPGSVIRVKQNSPLVLTLNVNDAALNGTSQFLSNYKTLLLQQTDEGILDFSAKFGFSVDVIPDMESKTLQTENCRVQPLKVKISVLDTLLQWLLDLLTGLLQTTVERTLDDVICETVASTINNGGNPVFDVFAKHLG